MFDEFSTTDYMIVVFVGFLNKNSGYDQHLANWGPIWTVPNAMVNNDPSKLDDLMILRKFPKIFSFFFAF